MASEQLPPAVLEHGADASADAAVQPHGLAQYPADQVERVRYEILSEQNLPFAIAAGVAAGLAGAIIWAVVSVTTGFQIGWHRCCV